MLRRGTRKRTASARAGVRRTPVVSKGVSSRASVQSSMTVTRPEAIYTTSGHDGAAIPTTATTVSTTRMLMPTFSSNQDNSVHIPDMLPWQPRRAIDPSQLLITHSGFAFKIKNKKPFYSIRINNDLREDAKIWLIFLEHFNGDCYLSENTWITNETLHLYTDSCGNSDLGCGAYFDGKWAQYKWPEAWSNMPIMRDITFLELVPIVLAMFIWASNFQNRKILFRIDNMALVSIINKRTAKSKRVMAFIRPLVLFTMQHNIQFKAQHIDGCKNEIADSISRFQLKRFRELAPGAESVPENNPEEFRDLILSLKQTD
ncbi:Hypothetical predicted protein [Mytilus galloprovincialis]|uniref:Uncharacterized protein n=1 Tax=Mytilus galloprovincialis TaxID=29158 RepID=A0A8B6FNW9_MYTGA|nr:Hypothetical predicted protein [Mytilus galloprovincialis]